MYSFENFPENSTNPNIKLTPRSNEALIRSGLRMEDLIPKNADQVQKKYGGTPIEKGLLEKRVAHEEEKRIQKIAMLREAR